MGNYGKHLWDLCLWIITLAFFFIEKLHWPSTHFCYFELSWVWFMRRNW